MRYLATHEFKDDTQDLNDPCLIEQVKNSYVEWVNNEQFLLLKYIRKGKKTIFRKEHAAKRGDYYYQKRTKDRFFTAVGHIPDYEYFSKNDHGIKRTDLILVTLTYEKPDMKNWISNGKHFQEFMNRMRKAYGKIEFIRAWESHVSGLPHTHVIMRIKEGMWCRRLNHKWRVFGKPYRTIKKYWTHGFSDIIALSSTTEMTSYLSKYITKTWNGDDGKHVLTLSLLWYYQKRSFSLSKHLFQDARSLRSASDLITTLHNSYHEGHWEYVGVFSSAECDEIIASVNGMELFNFRKRGIEQGFETFNTDRSIL